MIIDLTPYNRIRVYSAVCRYLESLLEIVFTFLSLFRLAVFRTNYYFDGTVISNVRQVCGLLFFALFARTHIRMIESSESSQ